MRQAVADKIISIAFEVSIEKPYDTGLAVGFYNPPTAGAAVLDAT